MAYPQTSPNAPPYAPGPGSSGSRSDIDGVGHLQIASVLGLVVQAMVWAGFLIFYLIFNALTNTVTNISATGGTSTTIPSWITPNTFYLAVAMLAGGLVLGIVSYIFFYLGFREVKRGAPDFGAPTTLVLIGLIGFAMTALGIVIIIGTIVSAINDATAGAVTTGSASLGLSAILSGIALIGIGAILALIGVIGLVLGNWRAGARYGQSTLKVGSILTIIPYVSIVGYILLLVGYMGASKKLKTGWIPAGPGWGGAMPGPGTPPVYGNPPQQWQAPPPPPPPR